MLLVCLVETVGCLVTSLAETGLTAADVDEQVDVVAGCITLQLLQSSGHGNGDLQCRLIVASDRNEVGQVTGRFCVDVRIVGTGGLDGCIEIELCHPPAVGPVAGIAAPVICLGRRQATVFLQTVCQQHQPLVVFCLVGSLYQLLGLI